MMLRRTLLSMSVIAILFTNVTAINLGGTVVSKDKFIVYLLIGHSQMAGIITSNNDNVTNPNAWVYRWATTKIWELAKETGSLKTGLSGRGTGGPGMPFLKQMVSRHSGYYFGVITNASPSSTCHGINSGSSGSDLSAEQDRYWRDAQLFSEIITAARAVQKDATLGGILCMLGTVEATRAVDVTVCQNFSNDISQMAKDMRDSLGIPNLPFVVADYEKGASGTYSVTQAWPAIIAKQLDSVPRKLSGSVLINSGGIQMFDDHHFTIAGEGEWAKRAVDSIEAKHFFPPPVAGVVERAAEVKAADAGTITVSKGKGAVKITYRSLTAGRAATLGIFNLEGKCLLQQGITGNGVMLNAAQLQSGGCFIARINDAGRRTMAKFYSAR
jgi:hypothetical protein